MGGPITENMHGKNLVNMYLAQYARGWSYTDVYILRDRSDGDGNQKFGFYTPDYTPRLAARYLHNLTTALADKGTRKTPGKLAYSMEASENATHVTAPFQWVALRSCSASQPHGSIACRGSALASMRKHHAAAAAFQCSM